MPSLSLSRHAAVRANQRGVTNAMLNALISYADYEAAAGDGCTVLRLSRDVLADRDVRRTLGAMADRLKNLAVVWSSATGEVITVLHDHGKAAGRRYRPSH